METQSPAPYDIAAARPDDRDQSPLVLVIARDLVIAGIAAGLALGAYAWSEASPFPYASWIGVLFGVAATLHCTRSAADGPARDA